MPKPNNFGTMGEVNTELSSDFTPPDIKKKKDADLPQIAGMLPGHKIGKPVETDVIPVINKGVPRIPSYNAAKCATPDNLTMKTINPRNMLQLKGSDSPGFKSVQGKIAEQYGGDMKKAGAILASRSRGASPAAKAKNPNLNKVKGEAKQKGFDDVEEKNYIPAGIIGGALGGGVVGGALGAGGGALFSKEGEGGKQAKKWGKRGAVVGGGLGAIRGAATGHAMNKILGDFKGFEDIEEKSFRDKVVAGTGMVGAGYVGSEIANRTQDARRLTENKRLTKEFEMADRGSASFIEMKEFMNADFVEKGGTSPETLPADRGDSAAEDQLKDVMNKKKPPRAGLKTESPDLTMSDDVAMVGDKAEDDITSGYVGDTQGAKVGKGYQAFNDLVAKGMVADVNINRYNVHESIAKINDAADVTMKRLTPTKSSYPVPEERTTSAGAELMEGRVREGGGNPRTKRLLKRKFDRATPEPGSIAAHKESLGKVYEGAKDKISGVASGAKDLGKRGVDLVKAHPGKAALAGAGALGLGYGAKKVLED